MKKIYSLLSVALLSIVCLSVQAEVISQELAKQTADNLLSLDGNWQGEGDADIRLVEHDGTPAYYIIEYVNGGWAIVAAQSSASPLIGYNTTGKYGAPAPMQQMLDLNAGYIVGKARMEGNENHVGWQRAMQRKPAQVKADVPDVAPLIPANLNQSDPFNKCCPSINGQKALVGCVAVGTTQAMMVHRFPDVGQGSHTYTDDLTGKHSIDYSTQEYDWDAIATCTETGNYDEVARILYHVGVAVNMQYSLTFSGAYTNDAYEALYKYFRYDKEKLQVIGRNDHGMTDAKWLELILNELVLGRALIYQGAANEAGEGGHCWNIDGWNSGTQKVHVNWGWGGFGDGYFDLDNMSDTYQGISFDYYHAAIFGVGTPTTAPYAIKLSTTKFNLGTAAGVALADVIVSCEDPEADYEFEVLGPKNVLGKHAVSPYSVQDGKLVASEAIQDANKFKYMLMTVTNKNSGESFTKEFTITIVNNGEGAVSSVMSDAMRVYPSVANDNITIEVPVAGGEYAIYSVSGVQVANGELAQYKNTIDVSSLTAGTYIMQYMHNDGVGVKTFIKK